MENGRLRQTMLLDLYGDLLTDKQRECYDLHCNEDLSLSEIAEQLSISRQGVWDNIRRAEASLRQIEEKTGLIRRFTQNQEARERLREKLAALRERSEGENRVLADEAIELLDSFA